MYQLKRKSDALRQLEEALSAAADSSESRHKIIKQGIDQVKVTIYILCDNFLISDNNYDDKFDHSISKMNPFCLINYQRMQLCSYPQEQKRMLHRT